MWGPGSFRTLRTAPRSRLTSWCSLRPSLGARARSSPWERLSGTGPWTTATSNACAGRGTCSPSRDSTRGTRYSVAIPVQVSVTDCERPKTTTSALSASISSMRPSVIVAAVGGVEEDLLELAWQVAVPRQAGRGGQRAPFDADPDHVVEAGRRLAPDRRDLNLGGVKRTRQYGDGAVGRRGEGEGHRQRVPEGRVGELEAGL